MHFGACVWMQRTDWPQVRDVWLHAEALGFDSLWTEDHLLADVGDWRWPKLEGWTTLAALAPLAPRPTIGIMVTAATFRNPGLVAKLATTVDNISDGRLVLGLGAGHFRREHEAFGLDFGATNGQRLDRLDEATGLVRQLLDGELVKHHGKYFDLDEALCQPRPIQEHLPILIGGSGREKTLRIVARHADIWNTFGDPEFVAETMDVLRARCDEIGRDYDTIRKTVLTWAVIRDTVDEALAEFRRTCAALDISTEEDDGSPRRPACVGTVESVAAGVRAYEAVGVDEIMWHLIAPFDRQTMDRLPEVRAALNS